MPAAFYCKGQAEKAAYISRKRNLREWQNVEVVPVSVNMVKSRLLLEFNFLLQPQTYILFLRSGATERQFVVWWRGT